MQPGERVDAVDRRDGNAESEQTAEGARLRAPPIAQKDNARYQPDRGRSGSQGKLGRQHQNGFSTAKKTMPIISTVGTSFHQR